MKLVHERHHFHLLETMLLNQAFSQQRCSMPQNRYKQLCNIYKKDFMQHSPGVNSTCFLFLPLSLTCMVCLTFGKNPLRCLSFHQAFPKTYYRAVRLLQIVQLFQIGELWRYLGCLYHGFLLLVENRTKDQHTRNKYNSIITLELEFSVFGNT